MIDVQHSETAPHLRVEAAGRLTESAVSAAFDDLPDHLATMPAGFVVVAVYPELDLIEAGAVGPLFYSIAKVFDAEPGLFIGVDGGRSVHPGLRTFIQSLDTGGQTVFTQTEDAAAAHIKAVLEES